MRQDVQDAYNSGLKRRMTYGVVGGCGNWYLSPDGENHALYPGLASEPVAHAQVPVVELRESRGNLQIARRDVTGRSQTWD